MESLRTATKQINGLTVEVQQFACRRAWRLTARLVRTLGPAIVPLLEGGGLGRADARSLAEAMWALTDDAADEMLCAVLAGTSVVGSKDYPGRLDLSDASKIDLAFGGDMASALEAAMFALEVNFGNFIERLQAALAPLIAKAETEAKKVKRGRASRSA